MIKARTLIETKNGEPVKSKSRPEVDYPTAKENVIAEWQEGLNNAVSTLANSLDKVKTLNFNDEDGKNKDCDHVIYMVLSVPAVF